MISEVCLRQSITRYFRIGLEEPAGIPCYYEDAPETMTEPKRLLVRLGNLAPRLSSLSRGHLELLPTSRKGSDEGYGVAEIRDAVMALLESTGFTIGYLDADMNRAGTLIIPDGGITENERLLTGPGDTLFKIMTVQLRYV